MKQSKHIFPRHNQGLGQALSQQDISIDGMKVLFDKPVILSPVSIHKKVKKAP